MTKHKLSISVGIILAVSITNLTGCSVFGNRNVIAVNEQLILPPSLKSSSGSSSVSSRSTQKKIKRVAYSKRNYYVVVGTYPNQEQALDTFVRLSSIGLPGATMESRKTKSGQRLHMVRLGSYQKQGDIDKVKDSLTNDGLSQFKVVEN